MRAPIPMLVVALAIAAPALAQVPGPAVAPLVTSETVRGATQGISDEAAAAAQKAKPPTPRPVADESAKKPDSPPKQ